jgi:hypothetical protein
MYCLPYNNINPNNKANKFSLIKRSNKLILKKHPARTFDNLFYIINFNSALTYFKYFLFPKVSL